MVILRLLPAQISRHWDLLRLALEETTIDGFVADEPYLTAAAQKLVTGQMQCWILNRDQSGGVIGIMFTSVIEDAISEVKNLLLIGLYIVEMRDFARLEVWKEGLQHLKKFGAGQGCQGVVFYTNVPMLVKVARELGATDCIFGTFKIE